MPDDGRDDVGVEVDDEDERDDVDGGDQAGDERLVPQGVSQVVNGAGDEESLCIKNVY